MKDKAITPRDRYMREQLEAAGQTAEPANIEPAADETPALATTTTAPRKPRAKKKS